MTKSLERKSNLGQPVSTVNDEGQYFTMTEQSIKGSRDTDAVKFFLTQCLKHFGGPFYRSWFEKLYVSQTGIDSITMQAPSNFHGETLFHRNSTSIQHILGMIDKSITHLIISYPDKRKDGSMHQEIIERRRL